MAQTVLFDRYRLLEPAGRGGSAEVWRARDEQTGDVVAVKRLHPIVFADEAGRRRLEREFHALQGLDEPHIVRVRDLQVGEREAALVLDYVDGESLAQRLARQTAGDLAMTPETAIGIIDDVASALAAAHAAGIVHRDVTPGNILLTREGEARLTDFGIAHASTDAAAVTATGLLMGTMRYLAPEQLRGGTSTPASDLHSLAAVAYEMLAGRPAYAATSPVALADAQQVGPDPIQGVPPALDAAVRRGLEVDPADRPSNVGAFASSLAAALADDQTTAIPIGGSAIAVGAATATATATAAGAATAASGDDIGVALPSRAAASHGPLPQAVGLRDRPARAGRPAAPPPSRSVDRGRRVPAAVVLALGVVLAVGLLAAAGNSDSPFGAAATRSQDVATPKPTARLTPSPDPRQNPGKGEDKGKGNDGDNGKGNDD